MTNAAETLIVGGTGTTGRRVAERLKAGGLPVRLGLLFAKMPDGRDEHLADGVFSAPGRPPRDVRNDARDAAATGICEITQ